MRTSLLRDWVYRLTGCIRCLQLRPEKQMQYSVIPDKTGITELYFHKI